MPTSLFHSTRGQEAERHLDEYMEKAKELVEAEESMASVREQLELEAHDECAKLVRNLPSQSGDEQARQCLKQQVAKLSEQRETLTRLRREHEAKARLLRSQCNRLWRRARRPRGRRLGEFCAWGAFAFALVAGGLAGFSTGDKRGEKVQASSHFDGVSAGIGKG